MIDWHNFGYSILALKLGPSHPLVKLSQYYENLFCRNAYAHFTVTDAMSRVLQSSFKLGPSNTFPLHDRPASQFQVLSLEEAAEFLVRCPDTTDTAEAIVEHKTRLLVSSTSWTADEDFGILMRALQIYSEKATTTHPQLPEILAVITGKGPLREQYMQNIRQLEREGKLEMVKIRTTWLEFGDYAKLLASADLGVSLHTSSSGVDLPMKVVDMFGAGIPVLGYSDFEAWPELVKERINGLGFKTNQEMAEKLIYLFEPDHGLLDSLRNGARNESSRRWDQEWEPVAGRLFGLVDD